MDLKTQLSYVVQGEVDDTKEARERYSHDASIFEVVPQTIVYPKDAADIARLITFVNQSPHETLSLTPRSGGTDMGGGSIGESIVIDMTRHINRLKRIEKGIDEGTAIVEPGMFYRDFDKETQKQDLFMPSYPASREICTVGGMVANNSGGEKTLVYGQTIRYVNSLKVVLQDGNEYAFRVLNKDELEGKMQLHTFEGKVYRDVYELFKKNYDAIKAAHPTVTKNSAGYQVWDVWDRERGVFDLTKLFVGSQGTLGIITEIGFRLVTPKKHSTLLVMFLKNLNELPEIIRRVLAHHPESFESYDDHTLGLAIKFFPDVLKFFKANIIKIAFQFLPEAWMFLTGGMPKLVLMAEFTGDTAEEAQTKAADAMKGVEGLHLKARVTKSGDEARKYWVIRRESFSLLRKHIQGKHTAPFIDDMVVHSNDLPLFLPKLEALLKPYNLTYTIAGHAGDANFHIIPLMDFRDIHMREIVTELSKKVYDLVFAFKGSMTGEHNDGMVRGPFLRDMYGDHIYAIFQEIKTIFDPKNIFNPHKKVDATLEYSMQHLRKD
ncbi:MAG: FAD-binding oxidoreductase [Parcubacteria group bacterium]|nr:FAD-binding oxidoreductase [Parcubacteria group bacterium]